MIEPAKILSPAGLHCGLISIGCLSLDKIIFSSSLEDAVYRFLTEKGSEEMLRPGISLLQQKNFNSCSVERK